MPRVYERKFDWGEAKRLREEGLTYAAIAERLGASPSGIQRALNPVLRARVIKRSSEYQKNGKCPKCGARASRNYTTGQHLCNTCWAESIATTVRPTTLLCGICREWKPDDGFPRNRAESQFRRFRHSVCRGCQAQVRQQSRERRKVPCVQCGEPRTHPNDNGATIGRPNTGLCRACFQASRAAA